MSTVIPVTISNNHASGTYRTLGDDSQVQKFPTESSVKIEEHQPSVLKSSFKGLMDYAHNSSFGSGILKFTATTLYVFNHMALALGVDLGVDSLIEGELNRKLFQPGLVIKRPKEPLEMIKLLPSKPDESNLYGYYFENPNSDLAVIYLHGYNGSMFECHPECKKIKEELNANVLMVDYRGFGISEGSPTIEGAVRDTERMYDYLINEKKLKGKNILIYGVSLGGALALETYVTKLKPEGKEIGAIYLLYPFSSIRDITKWRYPEIPSSIIPDKRLNSKHLARKVDIPIHLAHGNADDCTPFRQTLQIYRSARLLDQEQKEIYIIDGVGHQDIMEVAASNPSVNGYFESLKRFTVKHFPGHKL